MTTHPNRSAATKDRVVVCYGNHAATVHSRHPLTRSGLIAAWREYEAMIAHFKRHWPGQTVSVRVVVDGERVDDDIALQRHDGATWEAIVAGLPALVQRSRAARATIAAEAAIETDARYA